jgi:hypothetical protein
LTFNKSEIIDLTINLYHSPSINLKSLTFNKSEIIDLQ